MHPWISEFAAVGGAIGGVVTAIVAVYSAVKLVPWLKSQTVLARQLAQVTVERDEARDAAGAFRMSSDGWQAAVEQLGSEIKDLKEEIRELRSDLSEAILYIGAWAEADRHGKPRPPIPDRLRPLLRNLIDELSRPEATEFR